MSVDRQSGSGSSKKKYSIESLSEEWYQLNQKIKDLTEKRDYIKDKLEEVMVKNDKEVIEGKEYLITLKECKRRTVSIKNLPQEVADKYSKTTRYTTLSIKKKKNDKKKVYEDYD